MPGHGICPPSWVATVFIVHFLIALPKAIQSPPLSQSLTVLPQEILPGIQPPAAPLLCNLVLFLVLLHLVLHTNSKNSQICLPSLTKNKKITSWMTSMTMALILRHPDRRRPTSVEREVLGKAKALSLRPLMATRLLTWLTLRNHWRAR